MGAGREFGDAVEVLGDFAGEKGEDVGTGNRKGAGLLTNLRQTAEPEFPQSLFESS